MSAAPHFKIVGIPVRIEAAFFVIAGLFGLTYIDLGVDVVLVWVATTFVSILVHELGHGIALKIFGQPSAIVLHGFGGVTVSPHRSSVTRVRSVVVSLAGSLTALALLWFPARTYIGDAVDSGSFFDLPKIAFFGIQFIAFQNLWWSVANLLPIRPLDGGNVTAELFGLHAARRISIGAAIAGAIFAFTRDHTWAGFFALFLAFNNFQEIRAEQTGQELNAFDVDAPDTGGANRPARRGRLRSLPAPQDASPLGMPTPTGPDPAMVHQRSWSALRSGDATTAARMVAAVDERSLNPFLLAAVALATGAPDAFERFEAAYVANPSGPPNLVAPDVLARSGAAQTVAKRLVERADGRGREGAANLQTHLHYAGRFAEAAEVGEVVFEAGPASPAQTAFEVACSWARAGDPERAAEWLDRAADAGFRAASVVDGEPDLAPVRALPSWPVLRARLV